MTPQTAVIFAFLRRSCKADGRVPSATFTSGGLNEGVGSGLVTLLTFNLSPILSMAMQHKIELI